MCSTGARGGGRGGTGTVRSGCRCRRCRSERTAMRRVGFALLIVLGCVAVLAFQAGDPDSDVAALVERLAALAINPTLVHLVEGEAREPDEYLLYTVTSADDLKGIDPAVL